MTLEAGSTGGVAPLQYCKTKEEMMEAAIQFLVAVHGDSQQRIADLNCYHRDLGLFTAFVRNNFPD